MTDKNYLIEEEEKAFYKRLTKNLWDNLSHKGPNGLKRSLYHVDDKNILHIKHLDGLAHHRFNINEPEKVHGWMKAAGSQHDPSIVKRPRRVKERPLYDDVNYEDVMSVSAIAGTGDSRLPKDQREPGGKQTVINNNKHKKKLRDLIKRNN